MRRRVRRRPPPTPARPPGINHSRARIIRRRGRRSRQQLRQRLPQPVDQLPHVSHLLPVGDDPDVEVAGVAHHRDVEPHPVGDHRDGVVGDQPGARHEQRELRPGDVGDDEVPDRLARRGEREGDPRGPREHGRRDELRGVLQQLCGQRAMTLFGDQHRVVREQQAFRRIGFVCVHRHAQHPDAVAVGPHLCLAPNRDRNLRHERPRREVVVLDEPASHRPRADRQHHVVDRAAVLVLDRLDVIEREPAERKSPVR